ncbi:hypothetical protein Dimus_034140 [Dionaea muscipula]
MGYLSCKAESAISASNSQRHPSSHKPTTTTTTTTTTPNSKKQRQEQVHENPAVKIQRFDYRDLEAATDNFSDQKLLGRGSHGLVYKAVLRSGRLVAVKKPSRRSCPDPFAEFDNELHILSHIHNPRFVNLVGYSADDQTNEYDRRLLVVEFMSNGTLYDVLHSSSNSSISNNSKPPPNWGRRVRFAMQTAKAIETLHSQHPPVIHRDIKSANVLIDRNYNARLGDFGLALRFCHPDPDYQQLRSTPPAPAGTIGYLDPCYVTPDHLSTKNDVFSFGILLLEMISGRKAIDIGHSPPSVVDWAIPLIRKGKLLAVFDPRIPPPKDPLVRKQLALIAAKCVRSCRERRPTMKQIVAALEALCKLVPLHSYSLNIGIVNPCLMVETHETVVESGGGGRGRGRGRNAAAAAAAHSTPSNYRSRRRRGFEFDCTSSSTLVDDDGKFTAAAAANVSSRNSRRVFSDLGFRSNLMDLMAEQPDDDGGSSKNGMVVARSRSNSNSASHGSSFRVTARRRRWVSGDITLPPMRNESNDQLSWTRKTAGDFT